MSSNPLALTPIDGEPRVKDLHLADRLGFAEPRMIRNLIKRNHDKLLKFGICYAVEQINEGAGRPATEFYLNQKQAIFVCMKSETERAFDVQAEIVRVFDAYLNGDLSSRVASQPSLYRDLARLVRVFDLCRDVWAKQTMLNAIKQIAARLGIELPPAHMLGKLSDQMQLHL